MEVSKKVDDSACAFFAFFVCRPCLPFFVNHLYVLVRRRHWRETSQIAVLRKTEMECPLLVHASWMRLGECSDRRNWKGPGRGSMCGG